MSKLDTSKWMVPVPIALRIGILLCLPSMDDDPIHLDKPTYLLLMAGELNQEMVSMRTWYVAEEESMAACLKR